MKNFLFGVMVGALGMWFWLMGLDTLYTAVADMWAQVSSPPAARR